MVPSEASSRVYLRLGFNFREPPCIGEMKSKEKNKEKRLSKREKMNDGDKPKAKKARKRNTEKI